MPVKRKRKTKKKGGFMGSLAAKALKMGADYALPLIKKHGEKSACSKMRALLKTKCPKKKKRRKRRN